MAGQDDTKAQVAANASLNIQVSQSRDTNTKYSTTMNTEMIKQEASVAAQNDLLSFIFSAIEDLASEPCEKHQETDTLEASVAKKQANNSNVTMNAGQAMGMSSSELNELVSSLFSLCADLQSELRWQDREIDQAAVTMAALESASRDKDWEIAELKAINACYGFEIQIKSMHSQIWKLERDEIKENLEKNQEDTEKQQQQQRENNIGKRFAQG
ncbi:hypothetical protein EG329_010456 [Mollisiaceae sp. DMI_Dod_QoI]|nr:hypothetical protein EG329_010456 [Helotiales sp. DMI_Dod_QoI]